MIIFRQWLICIAIVLQGCDLLNKNSEEKPFVKLVPDHTPFIVSTLEATADTVHHYPEVFVGYLSDFRKGEDGPLPYPLPGIWWPVLNAQVYHIAADMNLSLGIEDEARVAIRGPLNRPNEGRVVLTYEEYGVYGDQSSALSLMAGERYELSVKLPDGRAYTAFTRLPRLPKWEAPDSVEMPLKLMRFSTGVYVEEYKEEIPFPYETAPEAVYTIGQFNYEYDYETFGMGKEAFLYSDRGPFWREGATYMIRHNNTFRDKQAFSPKWIDLQTDSLKYSEKAWGRLSQINKDLGKFYQNVFNWIAVETEDPWSLEDTRQVQAHLQRDTTYLFEISNIFKVGEGENVLPKDQSDAIGVFGGYSAAYRTTTLIPIRGWDPDTLNWAN